MYTICVVRTVDKAVKPEIYDGETWNIDSSHMCYYILMPDIRREFADSALPKGGGWII